MTKENHNTITELNIPAAIKVGESTYDVVEIDVGAFFGYQPMYDTNGDSAILKDPKKDSEGNITQEADLPKLTLFGSDYASELTSINFAEDNKVTKIGDMAFADVPLVDIVLPDNITTIGYNCFFYNNPDKATLRNVHLPANLSNPGINIFTRCINLGTVELPTNGFTKIPNNAFRGCKVKNLIIPDNITGCKESVSKSFVSMSYNGVATATTVENVYGTSSNAVVQSIANDIKAEDGTATKQYATNFDTYGLVDGTCAVTGVKSGTSLAGAVYMPEELNGKKVTALMHSTTNTNGGNIFKDSCDNLKEFYMADSITKILLYDGTNVTENNNTHYYNIFFGAKNLEKVHLSDNLTGLIRGMFPASNYPNITEIVIPDGVTEISRCFRKMGALKRVVASPDSKLTAITNESFDGSPLLEEVYLPGATITGYFYAGTFGNDTNLSSNLAIITTEANADSNAKLGAFAATKGIKVYTNVDANIISDTVVDGTGVTVTLRSRGLGLNAMEDGCKLVYAIYNSNRTLAKIVIKDQNDLDFTESLIKTVENADITVGDGETVKVYAWKGLNEIVPVAQPAK